MNPLDGKEGISHIRSHHIFPLSLRCKRTAPIGDAKQVGMILHLNDQRQTFDNECGRSGTPP